MSSDVEVPADLALALNGIPGLRQAFDALAITHGKEHVQAIEAAKAAQTRGACLDNESLAGRPARSGGIRTTEIP